jgi:hypothetical protein
MTGSKELVSFAAPDLNTLADLLSEFQLNVEAVSIQGISAALQGCKEAAEALERCISDVRFGASALRLACAQVGR